MEEYGNVLFWGFGRQNGGMGNASDASKTYLHTLYELLPTVSGHRWLLATLLQTTKVTKTNKIIIEA